MMALHSRGGISYPSSTFVLFAFMLVLPADSYGTSVRPLPEDGSLLLGQCQTTIKVMDAAPNATVEDTLRAEFCGDYIKGYADALITSKDICISADVTNGAMVRTYTSFIQKHPEFLKRYQGDGVRAALKFNYSCGRHKAP
jgi:hypothetical protein